MLGMLIVLTYGEPGRLLAYAFDAACNLALEIDIPAAAGVRNVRHWQKLGATVRLSPSRPRPPLGGSLGPGNGPQPTEATTCPRRH